MRNISNAENSIQLLRNIPGIVVAVDRGGEILFSNDAFEELSDSAPVSEIPTPRPCKTVLLNAIRRALSSGKSELFQMGTMGPGGPSVWYECDVKPVMDAENQPVIAICICHDMTQAKKDEALLKRSNSMLIDAEGIAHLGTWEWDISRPEVTWSHELYRIYGVTPEQYRPTYEGYLKKVHPDDRERVRQAMEKVFAEHVSFSHNERIMRPDGSIRHLHTWGHAYETESGQLIRIVGVCQDITEQILAEKSAQETQNLLQAIVFGTTDAVFVKDRDGRFIMVNEAYALFLHRRTDEIIGRKIHDLAPREMADILGDSDKEVLQSEQPQTFEESFIHQGVSRTWLIVKAPYRNLHGKVIGIIGIARDISDIKQNRSDLERSLSVLRATLESTADGILVIGLNEQITGFNQKFLELWNLPKDFIDKGNYRGALTFVLDQLKHPDKCLARLQQVFANPEMESFDVLEFKDGRVFERYSRPQKLGDLCVGRVFSYRDITSKVQSEDQARRYASRMKVLADASKIFAEAQLDLNAILNVACRFVAEYFQDGSLVRLFTNNKTKMDTTAFYHVRKEAREQMQRILPNVVDFLDATAAKEILKTGKSILVSGNSDEIHARLKPEIWPFLDRFPVTSWITAPVRVAGEIIGLMTVFRFGYAAPYTSEDQEFLQNLTDRAALVIDNSNLYAESLRAIQLREDFLSIASHELKTPLTPLKMQLHLLRDYLRAGKFSNDANIRDLIKLFDSSDRQIVRLTRLIEDMIDVSQMANGNITLRLEQVDLAQIARQVIEQFRAQLSSAGCGMEFLVESTAVGSWDRLRVEQVINNLLSNAIKYAPGNPIKITVSTGPGEGLIKVKDSGLGIDKKDQARIFDRFERGVSAKQFGGMGMGLYIARQIALAHGGDISVESELGKGATFTVRLPLPISRPA